MDAKTLDTLKKVITVHNEAISLLGRALEDAARLHHKVESLKETVEMTNKMLTEVITLEETK